MGPISPSNFPAVKWLSGRDFFCLRHGRARRIAFDYHDGENSRRQKPMSTLQPVTLITGASSGIGAAFSIVLADDGQMTVLVARRAVRLAAVGDRIAALGFTRPQVIALDLERHDASAFLADELHARGLEAAIVVNNAGFGLRGLAAELDRGEQLAMIDLNARIPTELSLRFVENLARHRGGIINLASIAGLFPGPRMAVYHASKAYVLSFSEALHRELAPDGVRVTVVCPGPVRTGFQMRAGIAAGDGPALFSQDAEHVAREAYAGFVHGQRMVVPGSPNKWIPRVARFVPHWLVLRVIDAYQRRPAGSK